MNIFFSIVGILLLLYVSYRIIIEIRDNYENRRVDRYNNYLDPEPVDNCKFKDVVNKSRFESKDFLLSEIVEKINKDGKN